MYGKATVLNSVLEKYYMIFSSQLNHEVLDDRLLVCSGKFLKIQIFKNEVF